MAMSCVKGGKECSGCMDCHCEPKKHPLRCKCGHYLNVNDVYYTSKDDGEVIGCEYCLTENQID